MAILKVAQMGHPILRTVAKDVPVDQIPTPGFQRFVDDMLKTMDAYDGAGLAATQVHTPLRVVALTLTADRDPEVWVNPVLTPLSQTTARSVEGCLSVDGLRGVVERPNHIRVDFRDRLGVPKAYELKGFPAVVAQHECDHLDGVLYVDRVDPLSLAFESELTQDHLLAELERLGVGAWGVLLPFTLEGANLLLVKPTELLQRWRDGEIFEQVARIPCWDSWG